MSGLAPHMPMHIDLNCDMGELEGGLDAELMPYCTSANVCCGLHAGGPAVAARTIRLARQQGVAVGAHPGYDDRAHFGRRELHLADGELRGLLRYQLAAFTALCDDAGWAASHVKLHGALYNQAMHDERIAGLFVATVQQFASYLRVVALAGSPLVEIARAAGLRVAEEAFADRAYEPNGRLRSRTQKDAILSPAAAAAQAVRIVQEGTVLAHDGSLYHLRADTICVHGDSPLALATVQAVREALSAANIAVRAFGEDEDRWPQTSCSTTVASQNSSTAPPGYTNLARWNVGYGLPVVPARSRSKRRARSTASTRRIWIAP